MKSTRSPEWSRRERSHSTDRKPSVTCFNARIDFLNNLSEGIAKKLPKQRKTSHARELEMPLPPGCFPEKVSLALSQSSSNVINIPARCNNNTISATTESSTSPPLKDSDVELENRVDSWYVRLSHTPDPEPSSLKPSFDRTFSSPRLVHHRQVQAFKRQTRLGSSLKLQNGSYPSRYQKKIEEEEKKKKRAEEEQKMKNLKNENTVKKPAKNDDEIKVADKEDSSLAESSISEGSSHTDTLSSELFDPLSDKIDDPFSRSSSALSKTPSLRSEQNSVFSIDSTYGTSEFSNYSSSVKSNNAAYEFDRLSKVLDHIDAETLRKHLKSCLTSKKPKLVKSLSVLLPRNKFKGQTTHCVRCHSEYDKHHGNMTCVLRHPTEEVVLISEDGESALFQCERCACVFKLDGTLEYNEDKVDIMNCGTCFTGHHTNNTEDVDYEPDDGFAKSCTEQGCAIFYV